MNKFGFGLMRLPQTDDNPEHIDEKELEKMIDLYMEKGFTHFDTAYPYHNGLSEKAFKKFVVDKYPRDSYTISDKLPIFFIHKDEDIEPFFNEQLERTGLDYFDYYMLHNVGTWNSDAFVKADSFKFLRQKKKEGLIKHIGISFHDSPEFLEDVLKEHPEIEFVLLQINYLDWDSNAIQSRKCYEIACKYDKEVMVMEPIKGGGLANIPEDALKVLNEFNPGLTPVSSALRFCASLDNVKFVFSGVSNLEQLKENMEIFSNYEDVADDEKEVLKEVADIIQSKIAIPCTSCNYCLEVCPKNIFISKYFELYNAEQQTEWKGFSQQLNYYLTYIEKDEYGRASDCIDCKLCVPTCPQHLDIPEYIKQVSDDFDPAADATNEFFS